MANNQGLVVSHYLNERETLVCFRFEKAEPNYDFAGLKYK